MPAEDEHRLPVDDEVIDVATIADGGVVKHMLRRGADPTDKPPRHAEVVVHYTGYLDSGEVFDSSRERNDPFKFRIMESQVIKGWDTGVSQMVPGERSLLVCRADYAYGDTGAPPKIPPGARLTFDVELISFSTKKPVTEDGGVMKEILSAGEGHNRPNTFATVTVRYVGRDGSAEGPVIDGAHADEPVTMVLDEDAGRVRGLEEAIKNMYRGERSRFFVKPPYGPPGGPKLVVYDVELLAFEKGRETWEMAAEEKLEHADRLKGRGNAHFKRKEFKLAVGWYSKANDVFRFEPQDLTDEQKEKVRALKCAVGSNLAACYLNTKDYDAAVSACNEALEADPGSVKALCRRGSANLTLDRLDAAEEDLKRALEIDGGNQAADALLKRVRATKKQTRDKERKLYGNLFGKVKLAD